MEEASDLAKKFPNIKDDFLNLRDQLKKDPEIGDNLGAGLFKIRMSISDKNKGKSGSARVIVYVKKIDRYVYVLSVYDKGEYDDVVVKTLKKWVKKI